MSEYVIQTHNLTRYFGQKAAVQQVNLTVPRGGVFALMGRNGSGKTTVIRMLLVLDDPALGFDPLTTLGVVAVIVLLSLLCGWLARRTARRYGFAKRETVCWVCTAVLLGPAGLLSLYCLREWPQRQPCHTCGELRPLDLEQCIQCGSSHESPPCDGTEILKPAPALST